MLPELYYHPLASYCWKALIALYETETPFTPVFVDLGDPASRAALERLWPLAKFPVFHDRESGTTLPEATIIIEHLASSRPTELLPADATLAVRTRLIDRIYDHYVHEPMQNIVLDRIRPAGERHASGVRDARALLRTTYALLERDFVPAEGWALGGSFTLADCSACPALHYANRVEPLTDAHPRTRAYLERLERRPSFARVLREAEPYRHLFPES